MSSLSASLRACHTKVSLKVPSWSDIALALMPSTPPRMFAAPAFRESESEGYTGAPRRVCSAQ
eukprot:360719-Chlamydomonas_euryale.AAC.18